MEDVFFDDGAVQIIRAIAEGDLGKLEAEADPVGRDVIEVIEVDSAHSNGAQRIKAGGRMLNLDPVVVRLIGQGNESGEAVSLVLERAELAQMVDPVSERLDMAVKHGASAAPP